MKERKIYTMDHIISNGSNGFKCSLEGVGDRPKTCANNPITHPNSHMWEICDRCPTRPVESTAKNLPVVYRPIRAARYAARSL